VKLNDPQNKITSLGIKANVKIAIYVSIDTVLFYGEEGQRVSKKVFIRAGLDDPLRLEPYLIRPC